MRRSQLLLIAAGSLVVRIFYSVAFTRGYKPLSDADNYYAIGRSVSRGHGFAFNVPFEYIHATAGRPPLFPTILAGAFRIFGTHVGVAQGVNIVAGTAAVVLGALIAQQISGPRAGICAGIVLALYPPLIANDVTVLVESTAVLLFFVSVLLLVKGRSLLAGGALGLLMLDRASAQGLVVVMAAWVLWRFGWRHALRVAAVTLLVIAPWVIRNAVNVGGPVLVTTNGFNLNATYSDEARLAADGFVDAYFSPRFATLRTNVADEVELDSELRKRAVHDLRAHPGRVFQVAKVNAEHWFELRPTFNRKAERLDGRNLGVRDWTLPVFYLVTAAGAYALVRARRSAAAQLLALGAVYFSVVSLASIAVPRLRSIFDGCLAVGAGLALAWALDRKVTVDAGVPDAPTIRTCQNAIALGLVAVLIAVTGFAWQHQTRDRARRAVLTAVARDGSVLEGLADEYEKGQAANEPPRLAQGDLDGAHALVTALGEGAPQVTPSLRPKVARALRAVRFASHEADVISLLGVGELLKASAEHRKPSVNAVKQRYEREIRPGDPVLAPWDTVMSGVLLTEARAALAELPDP